MNDSLPPAVTQHANEPVVPSGRHPAIFMPDRFGSEEAESSPPAPRQSWAARVARPMAYGFTAVLAVSAGALGYTILVPAQRAVLRADSGPPAAAPVTFAAIDAQADTVALALTSFDVRVGLFERRQMTCAELARGLVQVENSWISYSLARRDGPVSFDAGRAARDSALVARVKRVEHRFEQAGCSRP